MKIASPSRVERIEQRLTSVFESPEGELSSRAAMPSTKAFGIAAK